MNYATVSHGQAIFRCVYDSELGFMCGKCRGLLGFRPNPGDVCKCGARVEEAMYTSKRTNPPAIMTEGQGAQLGGLQKVRSRG